MQLDIKNLITRRKNRFISHETFNEKQHAASSDTKFGDYL